MSEHHSGAASPVAASPVAAQPITSVPQASDRHYIQADPFGDGTKISLCSPSMRVELLTLGAAINSVQVRDPRKPEEEPEAWLNVCLGYSDPAECARADALIGVTCGRFAGRIAEGSFTLDGKEYKLEKNEAPGCTMHGGPHGFQRQQWKYIQTEGEDEIGVAFHLTSPHLDQGFPGELYVSATYTLQKNAANPTLKYVYQAALSDRTPAAATVVNLMNHTYWNLNGVPPLAAGGSRQTSLPQPITNHCLQVSSKYVAALGEDNIPHGDMLPTEGTPHDYSELRCIRPGMEAMKSDARPDGGYDDPLALDTWDSELREAARLYSPATNLEMRVHTTNPAVVVYTANSLPSEVDGAEGRRFQRHAAICLECQYFPNSPRVPSFPSTVLRKGETYTETTTHVFKFLAAPPRISE